MTEPTTTAAPTIMQLAAAIAKRVHIKNVRLAESHVKREIADDSEIPQGVELRYGLRVMPHHFDPETKRLDVLVAFVLDGKSDDEDRRSVFRIQAAFSLEYTIMGESLPADEQLSAFAKVNGTYNTWPYWREYVQTTAVRMGLPTVVLPVLLAGAIEKMVRDAEDTPKTAESHKQTDVVETKKENGAITASGLPSRPRKARRSSKGGRSA